MATAARPPFVEHCIELLAPLGSVRVRRMFGGWGLYVDELFVALIAFDRLYLKGSVATNAQFEAAGCEPFIYDGHGEPVRLGYWTAPPDALDSPALMQPWARLAMQAALAARAAKPVKPRAAAKRAGAAVPAPRASSTSPAKKKRGAAR